MNKFLLKVIKPFLPTYEVVCTNYHVIPGHLVNKNQSSHTFGKGAFQEADAFYGKVINSDYTKFMAPVEVHLRRRGKIIKNTQYGPVEEVKKFKMAA
ncbi:hypothetical protein [Adhaeribacter aquaticus]|uniref:hypothetical protein n=1 Tax=Adhaeribacter aquaticus TaxID=299567 RepID=UPI000429D1F2|nr:hypothetical protein [Adhaeribacter aquaticus]